MKLYQPLTMKIIFGEAEDIVTASSVRKGNEIAKPFNPGWLGNEEE